jgi:gas vesicle protein
MELEIILGAVVALLGAASTFVAVRHKKVISEIKDLASTVQKAVEDKKITKEEQKKIMQEVIDVAHAISESWFSKKS